MEKGTILAAGYFHAFHRLGALVAKEKKYFDQEGLTGVAITATGEDVATIDGLENGKVDFGLDVKAPLVCRANSKGEKVFIIGGMINDLPISLISVKEVNSVADLKGKKVGTIEKGGGRCVHWVRRLFRENGLDPDKDLTWVTGCGFGSLEQQSQRLNRGDYQAVGISGWYPRPEIFERIAKAGFNRIAERSDSYPGGYPDRVFVTTGETIEKHPGAVKAFLRGMIRGYRFAKDVRNRAELDRIVMDHKWEKQLGWDNFDRTLQGDFGRVARFLGDDCAVKGLETLIAEEKLDGTLFRSFGIANVARLQFHQEAVMEVDARFGPGGYALS